MTTDTSFSSLLPSFTLKLVIWRLSALHTKQDRDDDVAVLELRKSFRERAWCQGAKDRPQIWENTSKGLGYNFLPRNAHSASALRADWEADPLDQTYRRVQTRLRNCFRRYWKTPKDGPRSLGNMFVRWWAAVVVLRALGGRARRNGKLAGRLQERPHKGVLREGRVLMPQSSSEPCVAQVPWFGSNAELHSIAGAG